MQLNGELWEQIRVEYLAGETAAALARKYGVSRNALYKRMQRGGWKASRDEIRTAADQRIVETKLSVAERLAGLESRLLDDLCGMLETLEPRWRQNVAPDDVMMIDRITRSTIALHDKLMPQEKQTVRIEVGDELQELGK